MLITTRFVVTSKFLRFLPARDSSSGCCGKEESKEKQRCPCLRVRTAVETVSVSSALRRGARRRGGKEGVRVLCAVVVLVGAATMKTFGPGMYWRLSFVVLSPQLRERWWQLHKCAGPNYAACVGCDRSDDFPGM